MQMMQDCESGMIDVILTKSLSRFARNPIDCLELVRRLQKLGVTIYFEKEKLNTGKDGIRTFSVSDERSGSE